jgi:hypothetical protein
MPLDLRGKGRGDTEGVTAEALADPYKGKISFTKVNAFQEPFASCQVILQDTPNIRKANQYLEHRNLHEILISSHCFRIVPLILDLIYCCNSFPKFI